MEGTLDNKVRSVVTQPPSKISQPSRELSQPSREASVIMPLSGAGSTSTPPTSSLEQEKMLLRIHHLFVATHRDIEELGYDVDNIVCRNVHVEVRREL